MTRKIAMAMVLGALVGLPTLGLGGRLAMFGFAQFTARPSVWTVRGTFTVAMSGAIAGSLAALIYLAVDRWLLPRARPTLRGLAFGALVLGVASPGIRPPWPLTFALFAPAFLAYGLFVEVCWRRVSTGSPDRYRSAASGLARVQAAPPKQPDAAREV
jgi:hypothetical protein